MPSDPPSSVPASIGLAASGASHDAATHLALPAPTRARGAEPPAGRQSDAVVLLPTYNERDNLPRIVPAVLAAAAVDVWVLDDASPDGTGGLAAIMAAHNPRVQVVHRPQKAGLGAAYIDGFRRSLQAGYRYVVQMDADFSHPVSQLPEMLRLAQAHDVVLGSRWVAGGGTQNWSRQREFVSRAGSFYARSVLGLSVRDLTGGFKCFRRQVLEALDLNSILSSGYAFQIEITYRALMLGFDVFEMPITFVERRLGASKMSRAIMLEALWKVPGLRLGDRL